MVTLNTLVQHVAHDLDLTYAGDIIPFLYDDSIPAVDTVITLDDVDSMARRLRQEYSDKCKSGMYNGQQGFDLMDMASSIEGFIVQTVW